MLHLHVRLSSVCYGLCVVVLTLPCGLIKYIWCLLMYVADVCSSSDSFHCTNLQRSRPWEFAFLHLEEKHICTASIFVLQHTCTHSFAELFTGRNLKNKWMQHIYIKRDQTYLPKYTKLGSSWFRPLLTRHFFWLSFVGYAKHACQTSEVSTFMYALLSTCSQQGVCCHKGLHYYLCVYFKNWCM